MTQKQSLSTRRIVLAALMAALTVAGSALRITLPISIMGTTSFHLGNIFCALSGILLGPGLGGLAAGLGSAIYDMFNPLYIAEAWLTFLMKGAYGLVVGLIARGSKQEIGYLKAIAATTAGAVTYAILYLAKSYCKGILVSGLTSAASLLALLEKVPATVFNAAIAIVCAPVLARAIRNALKYNRISLD